VSPVSVKTRSPLPLNVAAWRAGPTRRRPRRVITPLTPVGRPSSLSRLTWPPPRRSRRSCHRKESQAGAGAGSAAKQAVRRDRLTSGREKPPGANPTVARAPALLKWVRRVNSWIRLPVAEVNEPRGVPAVREWVERRCSDLDIHCCELRFVGSGISRPYLFTPTPFPPLTKPRLKGRSGPKLPVKPHDGDQRLVMAEGAA
jgi:hypothetical protein